MEGFGQERMLTVDTTYLRGLDCKNGWRNLWICSNAYAYCEIPSAALRAICIAGLWASAAPGAE